MNKRNLKPRRLLSTFGLTCLLAVATTVHADAEGLDGFGGPGMGSRPLMSERMADRLGLDDTQRQTIANIVEAARPEIEALREQMSANRNALEALDSAAPGYSTDLQDLAAEKGRLVTEQTLLKYRVRGEIHAVLTEEQQTAFENRKRHKRDGRRGRKAGRD